jgi:hypothetical protein
MNFIHIFLHQYARIINGVHLIKELLQSHIRAVPKYRILFSKGKPEWERAIKQGFYFTNHEIKFAELTPQNIADCDLLVPFTINELLLLNDNRDLISANPIPIPTRESILLCNDKFKLNQFLVNHGFGMHVPNMLHPLTYPYILKKKTDEWGLNSHAIFNESDKNKWAHLLESEEYFCQEMIAGKFEYTTHILFRSGKILDSLTIEYRPFGNYSILGSRSKVICRKVSKCKHLELLSAILSALKFEGICCFNYKLNKADCPQIFEINPRFGGSLDKYFFSFLKNLK